MVTSILPIFQLVLTSANIIILAYAFFKFLNKPQDTLNTRVTLLETELRDIKASIVQGNDKFKEQERTNATFKSVMLAFVDFEIAYCLHTNYEFTEDLMKAKQELQEYVSGK